MKKILMMIAALCACPGSHADGWYVGIGLGGARAHDAAANIAAGNSTLAHYGIDSINSYDNNGGALALLGGYRFSQYLATEFGYNYLGSYEMHGYTAPDNTYPAGRERNRADAFSVAAVLTAPLADSFALYGKLGPTLTTNEEWTCTSNVRWCDSGTDVNGGLVAGAGATIGFPRLIGHIRLEYDRFNHVGGDKEYTAGRFSAWQLQYVYAFGED